MGTMFSQQLAHDIEQKPRTKDVTLEENVTFQSMFLSDHVQQGLTKHGFRKPSPIQLKAIPVGRCGFDLIVKSKSGTGKTAVFSIIALEMLNVKKDTLQVLILAPTREIAVQSHDVIRNIGCEIKGLKVEYFIGGTSVNDDVTKAANCQIAVGSPGRIKHLITEGTLKTNSVKLFVLDEADKLLEQSYKKDISEIYQKLPERKQVLALSATYEDELVEFLSRFMMSPTYISAEMETPLLLGLKHFITTVDHCIMSVPQLAAKNQRLLQILSNVRFTQCLIFSNYQTRAESISSYVNQHNWKCDFISAAQSQTERLRVIQSFKKLETRILSSTDLTARGIDASDVDLVINYDVAPDAVTYLHRMGRAGRYGSQGICINIVSQGKEVSSIQEIIGIIGGTGMCIPVLDKFENDVDLRKVDVNTLEQLSGTIPKQVDGDVTNTLANEVLGIKYNKRNDSTCEQEGKSDKTNKMKTSNKSKNKSNKKNKKENCEKARLDVNKEQIESKREIPETDQLVDSTFVILSLPEDEMNKEDSTNAWRFLTDDVSNSENENENHSSDIDDAKKRKHGSTETSESNESMEDTEETEQKRKQSILCKNLALYSAAKLLQDGGSEKPSGDVVQCVGHYLKALKETDTTDEDSQNADKDPQNMDKDTQNADNYKTAQGVFTVGKGGTKNKKEKSPRNNRLPWETKQKWLLNKKRTSNGDKEGEVSKASDYFNGPDMFNVQSNFNFPNNSNGQDNFSVQESLDVQSHHNVQGNLKTQENFNSFDVPNNILVLAFDAATKPDAKHWLEYLPESHATSFKEIYAEELKKEEEERVKLERRRRGEVLTEDEEEEDYEYYDDQYYDEDYYDEDCEEDYDYEETGEDYQENEDYEYDENYRYNQNYKCNKEDIEIKWEYDAEKEMAMQPTLEWVPVTEEDKKMLKRFDHGKPVDIAKLRATAEETAERERANYYKSNNYRKSGYSKNYKNGGYKKNYRKNNDYRRDDYSKRNEDYETESYSRDYYEGGSKGADYEQTGDYQETSIYQETEHLSVDKSSTDYFEGCYNVVSNQLWNNGLEFDTTDEFNDWFDRYWQANLQNVREFVRKNIYLNEMNKLKGKQ